MSLGFWPNYRNTLGLLAKLSKYPFEVGMGFSDFELLGFSDFRLLIINGLLTHNSNP
jgi:hypothetical protein